MATIPIPRSLERSAPREALLALTAILFLSACGGCGGGETKATGASTGTMGSTGSGGADGGAMVDRGPTTIQIDGDPNGLWWDPGTGTLYIADSQNNRVLGWTDAGGLAPVSDLPAAAGGASLGQVVKTASGEILVTSFGFGTAGAVDYVMPDKTTGTVPGLDVTKRRIGLTVAADGTLYDGYFIQTNTTQIGAIASLDLTGSETQLAASLSKPVGVIASGTNLVVTDQGTNKVYVFPIATPSNPTVLVPQIPVPDLICDGPNGSYFTGGSNGQIRQIQANGAYTTFAGGFTAIRGVAYDAKNGRVFAAEHESGAAVNNLHILPVN